MICPRQINQPVFTLFFFFYALYTEKHMQKSSIFIVVYRNNSASTPTWYFIYKFMWYAVFSKKPFFQRTDIYKLQWFLTLWFYTHFLNHIIDMSAKIIPDFIFSHFFEIFSQTFHDLICHFYNMISFCLHINQMHRCIDFREGWITADLCLFIWLYKWIT